MHKPVMIVGEAYGEQEAQQGEAFVGPSGGLLKSILNQAGVSLRDCYLTNVFNERPPGNNVAHFYTRDRAAAISGFPPIEKGRWVDRKHEAHLARLAEELHAVRPNVILALGNTALWALAHRVGIKKYRGTPMLTKSGGFKLIPSWHPAAVLRQYNLKVVLAADCQKLARHMHFPELATPSRKLYLDPTIEELEDYAERKLYPAARLSCDVETIPSARQITEVGFAISPYEAIVIPFWVEGTGMARSYWTDPAHEVRAWNVVRRCVETVPTFGQNFQYDMQFFYRQLGIQTLRFSGDTMVMHHAMQPELEKSLGFLASIYTDQPAWKFMRSISKVESRKE